MEYRKYGAFGKPRPTFFFNEPQKIKAALRKKRNRCKK